MFRRVLVALDDAGAVEALASATMSVTRAAGCEVTVLSIHPATSAPAPSRRVAVLKPPSSPAADLAARCLGSAGYRVSVEVRPRAHESVAEDILDFIDVAAPDLVVIGSRGLSDFQALLSGSVSHRILAEARCPVLVVRDLHRVVRAGRILLAYDGSHHARRAAEVAAGIAEVQQASIEIVQVSRIFVAPGGYLVDSESDHIRGELASLATRLGDRAPTAWSVLSGVQGRAAAIAEAADELAADLVVMGSRGLSRIAGAVIGSVSHEVIHRVRRPVLLVP